MDTSFDSQSQLDQSISKYNAPKRRGTVKGMQIHGLQKRSPFGNARQSVIASNISDFQPSIYMSTNQNLKAQDIIDLKEIFDTMNIQSNGILAPHELQYILSQNGYNVTKQVNFCLKTQRDTVYDIIAEFDENEQGGLTFEDFLKVMNTRPKVNETSSQIKRIFRKYDYTSKGYIEIKELKHVLRQLQIDVEDSVLELIVKHCASGKDKKITFEDFYNVMTSENYY